ncbi:MAG: hypothetical protein ACTSX7_09765 [Alphaproteobacteria bacterium]
MRRVGRVTGIGGGGMDDGGGAWLFITFITITVRIGRADHNNVTLSGVRLGAAGIAAGLTSAVGAEVMALK